MNKNTALRAENITITKPPVRTVKKYTLVLLIFGKHNEKNRYELYYYHKNRRYTARQAWETIRLNKPDVSGDLSARATVFAYFDIIDKYELNEKYCDRYMHFDYF